MGPAVSLRKHSTWLLLNPFERWHSQSGLTLARYLTYYWWQQWVVFRLHVTSWTWVVRWTVSTPIDPFAVLVRIRIAENSVIHDA